MFTPSSTPSPENLAIPPFVHRVNESLASYCTLGVGGPARFLCEVKTIEQMSALLRYCFEEKLSYCVIGRGSNVLFDDRGFNGLVIINRIDHLHVEGTTLVAGAGHSFAHIGLLTARNNLAGLEFAAGIPGSVGGAVYMNAGAGGQETKDALVEVKCVTESGELICLKKEQLHFAYRTSSFQTRRGAIVEATFELTVSDEAKEKQKKLLEYRLATQPYKDKSAGSTFRNPEGDSAGRLIESVGLKGFIHGGAAVSTLHANFLINQKEASAQDLIELYAIVKKRVKEKTGVQLEEEVRLIAYE